MLLLMAVATSRGRRKRCGSLASTSPDPTHIPAGQARSFLFGSPCPSPWASPKFTFTFTSPSPHRASTIPRRPLYPQSRRHPSCPCRYTKRLRCSFSEDSSWSPKLGCLTTARTQCRHGATCCKDQRVHVMKYSSIDSERNSSHRIEQLLLFKPNSQRRRGC